MIDEHIRKFMLAAFYAVEEEKKKPAPRLEVIRKIKEAKNAIHKEVIRKIKEAKNAIHKEVW